MNVSDKCVNMIKHHEGFVRKPYQDPIGLWTIGVGHLIGDGKKLPKAWDKELTDEEVDELLYEDLQRFEDGVKRLTKVALSQGQFDALVSFSFNVGLGNLQSSTLRSKLNREDYKGAAEEFPKWRRAGGKVLAGLEEEQTRELYSCLN
jgi:lysozyme